jgi:hypothetical protein
MGEKTEWNAAHVRLFCELCAAEVFAGNRPLGHLNKVSWKNVEAKFFEKLGQKLEHLQLKNKWDNLKRSYTIFMELKNAATRLGWNVIRQTVDCDDKWWEEHLVVSVTIIDYFVLVSMILGQQLTSFVFDCRNVMIQLTERNASMCSLGNVTRLIWSHRTSCLGVPMLPEHRPLYLETFVVIQLMMMYKR